MARTCILRAIGLQMQRCLSLWCYVCFAFLRFVFMLSLKPRPFVQSSFDMQAPRYYTCFFIFLFFLFIWRCHFLRVIFLHHCRFFVVWRIRRTLFPSKLCSSAFRPRAGFSTSTYYVRVQSIKIITAMQVCMYGHTYSKSMDQPGKVANPARGQLNREN